MEIEPKNDDTENDKNRYLWLHHLLSERESRAEQTEKDQRHHLHPGFHFRLHCSCWLKISTFTFMLVENFHFHFQTGFHFHLHPGWKFPLSPSCWLKISTFTFMLVENFHFHLKVIDFDCHFVGQIPHFPLSHPREQKWSKTLPSCWLKVTAHYEI